MKITMIIEVMNFFKGWNYGLTKYIIPQKAEQSNITPKGTIPTINIFTYTGWNGIPEFLIKQSTESTFSVPYVMNEMT